MLSIIMSKIKNTLTTIVAAAVFATGAYVLYDRLNTKVYEPVPIAITVDKEDLTKGTNNVFFEDGMVADFDIFKMKGDSIKNVLEKNDKSGIFNDTSNIAVKYFLVNEQDIQMDSLFTMPKKRDRIYVGNSNLKLNNMLSGLFAYDAELDGITEDGSTSINPFFNNNFNSNKFKFGVEFYSMRNGKLVQVGEKIWGDKGKIRSNEEYLFIFDKKIDEEEISIEDTSSVIKDISNRGKVFFYDQTFGQKDLDRAAEFSDNWHPHYFTIDKKGMSSRINSKKMKNQVDFMHSKGDKVYPMVGCFDYTTAKAVINGNANKYSKDIVSRISKIGADGVLIDIESTRLNFTNAKSLESFLKKLDAEFKIEEKKQGKNFKIYIAVSPRFPNSEKKGFPHHGFYNYSEISKYVDGIEPMAYDFNTSRPGPSITLDNLVNVTKYAIDNTPKKTEIVILHAMYGRMYANKKSKKSSYWKHIGPVKQEVKIKGSAKKSIVEGELCLKTVGRIAYIPDSRGLSNKLEKTYSVDINRNIAEGYWRGSHASDKYLKAIGRHR